MAYLRAAILVVLVAMLLFAGAGAYFYMAWRAEASIAAEIEAGGGRAYGVMVGPAWLRDNMPQRFAYLCERVEAVHLSFAAPDEQVLAHLASLGHLKELGLGYTEVTDEQLRHIGRLYELEALDLQCTKIRDSGLVHLRGLRNLGYLNLSETGITDQGLRELASLSRLERLYLAQTRVTSDGLGHLAQLRSLCFLDLAWTGIAPSAVRDRLGQHIEICGEFVLRMSSALEVFSYRNGSLNRKQFGR